MWREMASLSSCSSLKTLFTSPPHSPSPLHGCDAQTSRRKTSRIVAAKYGGLSVKSVGKRCQRCGGQGAIECPGCKGTGRNKKNGNIFERWKCFDCQGFGLKSCPVCGKGGLTPEQRGER